MYKYFPGIPLRPTPRKENGPDNYMLCFTIGICEAVHHLRLSYNRRLSSLSNDWYISSQNNKPKEERNDK